MSYEPTDAVSSCCSAKVYNPSGLGREGICMDCKEHCLVIISKARQRGFRGLPRPNNNN